MSEDKEARRTNVTQFPPPPEPPEWLIGPFEEWRVIVDGREVPGLTGRRLHGADGEPDGRVSLCVDHRFLGEFATDQDAQQAAWLIAQASAIRAGYPHFGAPSKDQPFAAIVRQLDGAPL